MEINPIIGQRFDDHLETYTKMRDHFNQIQAAASLCKEALEAGKKSSFVVMVDPLPTRNIWQLN